MYADTNLAPMASNRSMMDRMGSYLAEFHDCRLERRDVLRLSEMDDHLLKDVGLTREQVLRGKPRPFRHLVA